MKKNNQFIEGTSGSSPRRLPIFRGYTIDVRLREFRKLQYGKKSEFIPFYSGKGLDLLQALNEEGIDYNPLTGELERL